MRRRQVVGAHAGEDHAEVAGEGLQRVLEPVGVGLSGHLREVVQGDYEVHAVEVCRHGHRLACCGPGERDGEDAPSLAIAAVAMPLSVVAVQEPTNSSPVVRRPAEGKNQTATTATMAITAKMRTRRSAPDDPCFVEGAGAAAPCDLYSGR